MKPAANQINEGQDEFDSDAVVGTYKGMSYPFGMTPNTTGQAKPPRWRPNWALTIAAQFGLLEWANVKQESNVVPISVVFNLSCDGSWFLKSPALGINEGGRLAPP